MYPDKHPHGMDEKSFNALFPHKCARDLGLPQQSMAHSHFGSWALQSRAAFMSIVKLTKHDHHTVWYGRASTKWAASTYRRLNEHHDYIRQHLEDMSEIRNWQWAADFSESAAPVPLAKRHPVNAIFTDS
jgi:hypothetical protein